jgi:enamine deaminase RidA (YjgF/YER057c/UK114 family)
VSASARLAELGLVLPEVAAPVAAYQPAVRAGELVWTSGQLPFVAGTLAATGLVGADPADGGVEPARATELARTCALNAVAAAAAVAGGVDRLAGVVKVVGYVACAPGFGGQPGVVDGASRLFGDLFGEDGRHARSAVGVAALPLGAPVEIEAVFRLAAPA